MIKAILFDKDGTLFDFGATWNHWAGKEIESFAKGDSALAEALAKETRYDLKKRAFLRDSPIIAGTSREAAECFGRALPGVPLEEIEAQLNENAATAPLAEAVPLGPLLARLRSRGLRLGVMTNDTEYAARKHLQSVGVESVFDFIAGSDSGYGAKPDPAPLLAFSSAMGLAPSQVVMVGDSTHDLLAGRAAGMATLGVLTGPAEAHELAPLSDAVLPDIGGIPDWLDQS